MKRLLPILLITITFPSFAQTHYPGKRHTVSHKGQYIGGMGKHHKGGKYHNPRTLKHYGKHK